MTNGAVAAMTLGISVYSAVILVCIAIAIHSIRHGRRSRAITAAVVVGVLTIAGVVIAVLSSIV